MRKNRFVEEQIVGVLTEGDRRGKTGEIIRRHAISRETNCVAWTAADPRARLYVSGGAGT